MAFDELLPAEGRRRLAALTAGGAIALVLAVAVAVPTLLRSDAEAGAAGPTIAAGATTVPDGAPGAEGTAAAPTTAPAVASTTAVPTTLPPLTTVAAQGLDPATPVADFTEPPAGWQEVSAADGSLRAWMPGTPGTESVLRNEVPASVLSLSLTLPAGEVRFAVLVTQDADLPLADDAAYLRQVATALAEGRSLARAQAATDEAGLPMLDVVVDGLDRRLHARLQVVGDRMITVQTSGPPGADLAMLHAIALQGFRVVG